MLHRLLIASCLGLMALAAWADENLLVSRPSTYNGTVIVSEDRDGLRTMRFGQLGARQTVVKPGDPDHLELAYARAMPTAFIFVERPRNVLVIGLGGGTIPSFLHKRFPEATIDVVDIDPVVVELARSHFGFREDVRMQAHVQDGRKFVERAPRRYDIVFLDGFGTENVPPHLATREFLQAVRRILTPTGIVVGNLWGRGSNRLYDAMVKTYRVVFPHLYVLDVPGSDNKLVFGLPRDPQFSNHAFTVAAAQVSERLRLRAPITETVERNLRLPGDDGERGEVLLDRALTDDSRRSEQPVASD